MIQDTKQNQGGEKKMRRKDKDKNARYFEEDDNEGMTKMGKYLSRKDCGKMRLCICWYVPCCLFWMERIGITS